MEKEIRCQEGNPVSEHLFAWWTAKGNPVSEHLFAWWTATTAGLTDDAEATGNDLDPHNNDELTPSSQRRGSRTMPRSPGN